MIIRPKNWAAFQHYKDRSPSWIKLHKSLLDDFEYHCLPLASRALAPMLWLLASEGDNGEIECDWKKLAFRLRAREKEIEDAVKPLIQAGFFIADQDASELLADCYQDACPEKRREEEEKSKRAHTMPKDFKPTDKHRELAGSLGVSINDQFRRFTDHHLSKGTTFKDWGAALNNWLRRSSDFNKSSNPQPPKNSGTEFTGFK